MKEVILILSVGLLASCTDAQMGKFKSLGNQAEVKCYSGGKLIYEGISTGKISSEESSDGYYFVDVADGRSKEVSGNCIVTYLP